MNAKRSHKEIDKPKLASKSQRKKKQKRNPPDFTNPDTMVTFIVGTEPDIKKFMVHKEHVCYASPVLDAAFHSEFIEGRTQTYRLDDVKESVFRLFVQYLYSGKLFFKYSIEGSDILDQGGQESGSVEFIDLVRLWQLGDKFFTPRLQNLTLDSIEQKTQTERAIPIDIFEEIYAKSPGVSLLRSYVVELAATSLNSIIFRDRFKWFSRDLLIDLVAFHSDRSRSIGVNHQDFYVPVGDN